MTFRISGCMYGTDMISVVDSNFHEVENLEKNKTNYLTVTFDLERQGQTHFYMTFVIFGCMHDTDLLWCRF